MTQKFRHLDGCSSRVAVNAPPEAVYDIIADVERTPERSPECRAIEWVGTERSAVVGATFRGQNRWRRLRWWREVQITAAVRGHEFAFETKPGRFIYNDTTKWRYQLEPSGSGTVVTESYELFGPRWIGMSDQLIGRPKALQKNLVRSLDQLRDRVEKSTMGETHDR